MLILLVSWIYIFTVCAILGAASLSLVRSLCFPKSLPKAEGELLPKLIPAFMAGILVCAVYAQLISLFLPVGVIAQLLLLLLCGLALSQKPVRETLAAQLKSLKKGLPLWKALLYLGILCAILFFASRGQEHTDTSTYHALSIHFIEEYGVLKGLGNLMGNIAYNSSWLPFTALFSLHFLSPLSLHGVNGLLALVLSIYALEHLLSFHKHNVHITDLLDMAILFYVLVVACVLQSPATDQPAMLFSLYVLTRFAEETEYLTESLSEEKVHVLALLSVAAVFSATLKLSTAPLALVALAPAFLLIKNKQFAQVGIYLACGILTILPFLVRNFFVSGYPVYPFPSLDIFPVDWKIPLERVIIDSDQIKTYARTLPEVEQITMGFKEWFPIWLENTENYDKLLLAAAVLSAAGFFLMVCRNLSEKKKSNPYILLTFASALACMLFWLLNAPTVRFGLAYLLALPAIFLGSFLAPKREGILTLILGFLVLSVLTCLMPYWNHYVTDDLLFVRHHLTERYYVVPKDYERFDAYEIALDGVTFYRPGNDGKCGYYGFPACMRDPKEVELRGETIRDGFRGVIPEE